MTDYIVTDTELISVADAIRAKGGTVADLEWPIGYIAAINAIPTGGGGVTIVDWATGTDAEIAAMIDAAHNGDIDLQQDGGWAVGDVRTIEISAFTGYNGVAHGAQNVDIVISQFGDYMNCGSLMQFDFKNSLLETEMLDLYGRNTMGYGGCGFKSTTHNALVNALPSWLKDRLIEFSCLAGAGNNSTTIQTITGNKLALRAEVEVTGGTSYSLSGEGAQIDYYKTSGNRGKKNGSSGSNQSWWLRSPSKSGNQNFAYITNSTGAAVIRTSNDIGISPFGCL